MRIKIGRYLVEKVDYGQKDAEVYRFYTIDRKYGDLEVFQGTVTIKNFPEYGNKRLWNYWKNSKGYIEADKVPNTIAAFAHLKTATA